MNKKLIYILPEASTKTHMKYNVEFIKELGKEVEIFLIIEKGTKKEFEENWGMLDNGGEKSEAFFAPTIRTYFITTNNPISRILKLNYFLFKACLLGYRKVYIHYSFAGAFFASLNPFFTTYYWNCGMPWQYKRPFWQELYESATYKFIDYFVTGQPILTKQYANFYKFNNKKSIVIPNWIDVEKWLENSKNINKADLKKELNISENTKVLFSNQRLSERKGIHCLPIILESLKDENIILLITNDGPYKEKLLEKIKALNLENKIRFIGKVPVEKVNQLLSIVDVFLLPSEEEGMSHSLMEAFACAKASISFQVGGTLDMYPDNFKNYCLPSGKTYQFTERVKFLLNNENERDLLSKALQEKVKEWDKQKIIDIFIKKIFN